MNEQMKAIVDAAITAAPYPLDIGSKKKGTFGTIQYLAGDGYSVTICLTSDGGGWAEFADDKVRARCGWSTPDEATVRVARMVVPPFKFWTEASWAA